MINFDEVEREIELLLEQGEYKETVEKLKYVKRQSECEGGHEYQFWIQRLKDDEGPLHRLIRLASDDALPPEEKFKWLLDWECISKDIAIEYLENDLIPKLLDSKSIEPFLYRYCDLLDVALLEKDQVSKDKLQGAEQLINSQILSDYHRAYLLQKVIIVMGRLRFDEECMRMLDTYSDILPDKEELYIKFASDSDNIDIVEKSIVILKNAFKKIKLDKESQDLLPRVFRYRDKVYKFFKDQIESVEILFSQNIITDNLPDVNVVQYIYDFVKKYELGKYEFKSPLEAEQFLRYLIHQDIMNNINLIKEGEAIVAELSKRGLLNKRLSDIETLGQKFTELEERYYNLLLEKLSKDTNSILSRMKDKLEVPFEEAARLVEECFNEKTYRILSTNEDIFRYVKSAEWVWRNNEHMASMNKYNNDNGQDLTFLICGYCKTIETFLYYFVMDINERFPKIKYIETGINAINVDIKSENFNNTTLADYYNFILEYHYCCIYDGSKAKATRVMNDIKDWVDNYRNAHLHKDAVIEYNEAKKIREKSIELLEMLTKELSMRK